MCDSSCIRFAAAHLKPDEIRGRDILEVGSRDVNGSVRSIVQRHQPSSYVGVDIEDGPGVDQLCDATALVPSFRVERFDAVISTELLEHVRDWRTVINQIKEVLRPDGVVLITTRSKGFGLHGFPYDYWRYEPEDMRRIFNDFEIESIERDSRSPGVFLKARKPLVYTPARLDEIALYSIVRQDHALDVAEEEARQAKPPFSLLGFCWSLLPERIRLEGIRPMLRRVLLRR
jgi:SAM-dependent methyltransferase